MPVWIEALFIAVAAVAAAIAGAWVGARRGLRQTEDRVDKENAKLISALTERVQLLEKSNVEKDAAIAELNKTIAAQNAAIATLQQDLAMERAISARLMPATRVTEG